MNGSIRRYRNALVALAALAGTGCFSYIPAEIGAVPEGQDVRVYLTRQGMFDLEELPNLSGPYVRGMLSRREGEGFYLRVPVATRQEGFHQAQIGQDVWIPVGEVVQLERRQLNRGATGLLIAGTAGVAAGVVLLIMKDHANNENPVPPDIDEVRIPLFSIPIG